MAGRPSRRSSTNSLLGPGLRTVNYQRPPNPAAALAAAPSLAGPLVADSASPADSDITTAGSNFRPLAKFGGFNGYEELTVGDPESCPYIHIQLQLWIDVHAEAHFPVKFDQVGDTEFTATSLGRPVNEDVWRVAGPLSAGTIRSEDFSMYSGWGGGIGIKVQVGCKEAFGGNVDALDFTPAIGFRNDTYQSAPLAGSKSIDVPADGCPQI